MSAEGDGTYRCRRVASPPPADAGGWDAFWDAIPPVGLVDVATGGPARQATTARLCWDPARLYVAFDGTDDHVVATHRTHDAPLYEEDVFEVFLDPYGHGRVYYELEVNPLGATFDALVVNRRLDPAAPRDQDTLTGWDPPGFTAVVRVEPGRRWRAQLAIPLAAFAPPAPPAPGDRWGMNLFRVDRHPRGDEYLAWRPTGRVDFHRPAAFGVLEFADPGGGH